jgi:hypothetical protein
MGIRLCCADPPGTGEFSKGQVSAFETFLTDKARIDQMIKESIARGAYSLRAGLKK